MKKKIIIIDNESQSEEIERLVRIGRSHGIEIDCEEYNVGSPSETGLLTKGQIDIEKVISVYRERYNGMTFSLAAFDWDLNDDRIDGVELIRQLKANRILHTTPKLLYSGLMKEKLRGYIDSYDKREIAKDEFVRKIITLINTDILGFYERDGYDAQIISHLKRIEDSFDFILQDELTKFPEIKFKASFPRGTLNGKTFREIKEIIDNDDRLRNELKRELLDHVIAYLSEKF